MPPIPLKLYFTRGTTEAINLVASSYGRLIPDDAEIIVSVMEHHADIVPWQLIGRGVTLRVIPMDDSGVLDLDAYRKLFNEKTALVAVTHVSNVLGTVNPVEELCKGSPRSRSTGAY